MEASLSPMKRRAVLGAKDANAALATPNTNKTARIGTPMLSTPSALLATSPLREVSSAKGKKRTAEEEGGQEVADESPETKKACVDGAARSRSPSIETSSLFDTSAGDASWTTAPTEVDTATAAADTPLVATRPSAMTREQAREKAEILRLRLGLAGYKLRTGQTTIPLSKLQHRPLPPATTTTTRKRASTTTHAKPTNIHSRAQSADSIPQVPALSSQESTTPSATSDAMTLPASQESVVVETRGNTPEAQDEAGNVERDKAALLPIGELDSPCKFFQSSPAPAPVSSLRSTCTDVASNEVEKS